MSIATGLIAKLLLAISVIPAAGYGGYCVYDHCYPTFHNQLIGQGWTFSPIDGDMGSSEDFGKNRGEVFKTLGGDWRCTKQLFTEIKPPAADDVGSAEYTGTIPPTPASSSNSSSDDSVGCLVADLGYVRDARKKAGFLKWELALRSGDRGFIYVGYFSIGKSKYKKRNSDDTRIEDSTNVTSFSTVFEVSKDSGTWNIKSGFNWTDYFTTTYEDGSASVSTIYGFSDAEINIYLADKYSWNSNGQICSLDNSDGSGCGDSRQWEFQRYVGFWEEKTVEGEKQVVDAIKITAKRANVEHLHDIWSNQEFDFSKSAQEYSGAPAWGGAISRVYDATTNEWKSILVGNARDYLKAIYSPWAKKKGTWMEAEGVCHQSNSRSMKATDEEAKRLLKFCYKNKDSSGK